MVKRLQKAYPKKVILNAWLANEKMFGFCKDTEIVSIPWERYGKNEDK